ncbi:sulfatase-like hydrolase/transferase [Pseudoalteromonas sp. Hal273]
MRIHLKYIYWLLLLSAFSNLCYGEEQPNILLIIADDAGYHDFGFQGSEVMQTPTIDKLASQSVVFEQAYVTAAVCGPSRAGLYTGKYQQRFGFEENNVPGYMSTSGFTGDKMGLPLTQVTMADHLKDLGYQTGLFGKWHQGNHDDYHPTKRGFDNFYGFREGARGYFAYSKAEQQAYPSQKMERDFKHYAEHQGYLTDALATQTSHFITQSVANKRSFFAVLSFSAVHAPMQATDADLAQFPHLTGERKILAAMNFAMDRAIAVVLNKLNALSISDNTLVVFINDNGGPTDQNYANNYPLSGTKANHLEGGVRVPMLLKWPKRLSSNTSRYTYPVSSLDLLPTFIHAANGKVTAQMKLDGVDLMPFLLSKKTQRPHQTLYWKKESRAAIRDKDLKLLRFPDRPAELYDLSVDASENHNLASKQPNQVARLMKKLFHWELTLERPLWQLKRVYEGHAMTRMDNYSTHQKNN